MRCWFWHTWGKWHKKQVRRYAGVRSFEITIQARTCERCGLEKWRDL